MESFSIFSEPSCHSQRENFSEKRYDDIAPNRFSEVKQAISKLPLTTIYSNSETTHPRFYP
jgi:hypothetical protein